MCYRIETPTVSPVMCGKQLVFQTGKTLSSVPFQYCALQNSGHFGLKINHARAAGAADKVARGCAVANIFI